MGLSGRQSVGVLCPFDATIRGILRLATRGEARKRGVGSSRVMSRRRKTVQCRASAGEIARAGAGAPAIRSATKLATACGGAAFRAPRHGGSWYPWISDRHSAMIGLSGAGERACRTARTVAVAVDEAESRSAVCRTAVACTTRLAVKLVPDVLVTFIAAANTAAEMFIVAGTTRSGQVRASVREALRCRPNLRPPG